MAIKKLAFIVDKLPYKAETSRLAFTHAIASQTVEIYLEDGDNVEPVIALIGDGVLNAVKDQKALDIYGVTSLEMHMKNALLLDLRVLVCKEDMERLGLTEDKIVMDAEEIGGELTTQIVPFDDIMKEIETSDHVLYF
jgi:sulfur relay (sulfurtransferase) DsrF/TusC family protein